MTSDEFGSRYKLLKQMVVKEGRSYTAEHLASGRAVLVHIVEESRVGGNSGLQAMLQQLSSRERSRVLDTMTVEGALVVVTQFLHGFEGFESWLRARVEEPVTPPAPASPPTEEVHGEFTRLFRSAGENPGPSSGPTHGTFGAPPAPPPAGVAPSGSEFTDLFRAPGRPASQPPDPASTIPPVRMVGVRLPMPPSEPAPGPRLPPPQLDPAAPVPPPKLTPNFDSSGTPDSPSALAGWPRQDEVVIRAPDPGPAPLPPPSPSWGAPSEYTQLFGSPPAPTGELALPTDLAAPPEATEEKPERKRSYIPLFVILNVVFILATGLVVYFALRRC
jgi:hypothetical protein